MWVVAPDRIASLVIARSRMYHRDHHLRMVGMVGMGQGHHLGTVGMVGMAAIDSGAAHVGCIVLEYFYHGWLARRYSHAAAIGAARRIRMVW